MGNQPPIRHNLKYRFSDSGCKANLKPALVLFSGGLDSLLAVKILQSLNFDTTALIFESAFFRSQRPWATAKQYGIAVRVGDISAAHLEIVKNPRYGYGKNMNPCIDCHLLMLLEAKKVAAEMNGAVIATGEVLGQRPMSQNKGSLDLIEKKSGLVGRILRPLSARLLPPTEYETSGIIDRDTLHGISGRGRKTQFELAKKFNLHEYATPSGGCILTDPIFSDRLRKLLLKTDRPDNNDIALIKTGRLFWEEKSAVIIGRNESDNNAIRETYIKESDVIMELADFNGPVLLIRNFGDNPSSESRHKELARILAWYYPRVRQEKEVRIKVKNKEKEVVYSVEPTAPTSRYA